MEKINKFCGEAQHYAGSFINRAVQRTEEAFHSSEKTDLDPQVEALCKQADDAANWTHRIIKDTESVLVPNPGHRIEDYVMEKMDGKPSSRTSNTEVLGQDMIDAGNDVGAGPFGNLLIKVGSSELKLGQIEREFITTAVTTFLQPMHKFLDNEVKTAAGERNTLENKRLDLDAAKNKFIHAQSNPPKEGTDHHVLIQQTEHDVMEAQTEFNKQSDITKVQLEVLIVARDRLVENVEAFAEARATYFARCHQLMLELKND